MATPPTQFCSPDGQPSGTELAPGQGPQHVEVEVTIDRGTMTLAGAIRELAIELLGVADSLDARGER
ncbi:Hypothetical protein MUW33_1795 [Mycobacterium canetti]|uniref:hypothetical protein n=1 Tax=Mycobacterium canetti TaxID=78331 RepID=UPI002D79CEED|nr:hypothetical protein [Mycobacterium canetti]WRO41755.1 Hypothetical protein MUW33_1795 [Mycobacterium canetti]